MYYFLFVYFLGGFDSGVRIDFGIFCPQGHWVDSWRAWVSRPDSFRCDVHHQHRCVSGGKASLCAGLVFSTSVKHLYRVKASPPQLIFCRTDAVHVIFLSFPSLSEKYERLKVHSLPEAPCRLVSYAPKPPFNRHPFFLFEDGAFVSARLCWDVRVFSTRVRDGAKMQRRIMDRVTERRDLVDLGCWKVTFCFYRSSWTVLFWRTGCTFSIQTVKKDVCRNWLHQGILHLNPIDDGTLWLHWEKSRQLFCALHLRCFVVATHQSKSVFTFSCLLCPSVNFTAPVPHSMPVPLAIDVRGSVSSDIVAMWRAYHWFYFCQVFYINYINYGVLSRVVSHNEFTWIGKDGHEKWANSWKIFPLRGEEEFELLFFLFPCFSFEAKKLWTQNFKLFVWQNSHSFGLQYAEVNYAQKAGCRLSVTNSVGRV